MKHALVGLHLLHVPTWAAAAVQSILLQRGGGISVDMALGVGLLGGASLANLVLAGGVFRKKRGAAIASALLFFGFGSLLLLSAVPMVVLPLLGPSDSYILPLGVIGSMLGGVHALAGVLAWRLQGLWQVDHLL